MSSVRFGRRRLAALALAALVFAGQTVSAGEADNGGDDDGDFDRRIDKDDTEQGETDGNNESGGDADPTPKIWCSWTPTPATEQQVDVLNLVVEILANLPLIGSSVFVIEYFSIESVLQRYNTEGARFERYERANCDGATDLTAEEARGYRWVAGVPPEAWILSDQVSLVVSGRIQVPDPEINPPERAPINLGLWLAVDDPGPIVAEGSLGPLWLRGTARLVTTTFNPGNGTPTLTCDGAGSPIENLDTVEEGPCGYTYRAVTDVDAELAITITSTWSLTWETSDGSSAGEPPVIIRRTTVVPYDVYEIQTVGTG